MLALASGYVVVQSLLTPALALQWLLQASLVAIVELSLLWSALERNRRDLDSPLLSNIGAGNAVTLGRGLLISLMAGFLFMPWPSGWVAWIPGLLYTLSVVADYLDGYLARITNHTTELGSYLDMEYDVLGMIIAPVLAVWYGQLPLWYLVVSVARYAYIGVEWWQQKQGKQLHEINDSLYRRLIAGCQMVFVFIVLIPVYNPPETHIAAAAIMLPLLLSFTRDLLVMTGTIRLDGNFYQGIDRFTQYWLLGVLPTVLRLVGVALLTTLIVVADIPLLFTITCALLAVLLGAGILTRLAGIGVALVMGFVIPLVGVDVMTGGLLFICLILLVTGGGRLSLWQPEDAFFLQRGGA